MRSLLANIWGASLGRHLVLAVAGGLVVALVLQSVSDFTSVQLSAMAYLGVAAGGLTVLTGLNGQISLGHGALMAIGAYTAALMLQDPEPALPLLGIVVVSTLVTLLVGALVGVAAARLHGPYLAGATLALAIAVPGIALRFSERLGGEAGLRVRLPEIPEWVLDAAYFVTGSELTRSRYIAYLTWLCLIVAFVLLANLSRSRVGRRWRAVRDDEVAAELAGISLGRSRVSAFMVSAAAAGSAGALMAFTVRLAAPSGYTLTLSLTLLAAVVLGGLGSLTGALIGAALLTFLPDVASDIGRSAGLTDIKAAQLAPLVYGLVMIAVILLAPAGIVGSLRSLAARRRHTSGPDTQTRTAPTGAVTTSKGEAR